MSRPSTEDLQTEMQELVETHNNAVKIQQDAKQRIIEIQAVLKDRADGIAESSSS